MITKKQSEKQNSVDLRSMEARVRKLTVRLWAVIFLLFLIFAAGGLLFYEKLVLALSGDYTKVSGDL